MKYALLIYDDPKAWADADEESKGAMMEEYGKFWDDLESKGMIRGGQQLAPHTSATVVSAENGQTLTTDGPYADTSGTRTHLLPGQIGAGRPGPGGTVLRDGPYAETKEVLGGFFVIECDTLDEAIEAASRIPSLKIGGQVEVRPIVEM